MDPTLRIGATGPAVGELHQLLTEDGCTVDTGELTAGQFGPSTEATVQDWQARHVDAQGHALVVDGVVGPATWASLRQPGQGGGYVVQGWHLPLLEQCPGNAATAAAVLRLLADAAQDLGRHEDPDGSNDGPGLVKFHTEGRPWCALAVSTWLQQQPLGSPWHILAGAYSLRDWSVAAGRAVTPAQLQPGDVWGILRAGGHGHVGLVVTPPDAAGVFCTLEGNSSNAVRGLRRRVADMTYGIRPWAPLPGQP